MVRFEKIAWEKFINSKALKRERVIGSPQKWHREDKFDNMLVASYKMFEYGISGKVLRMVEPLFAYFGYNWIRDIGLQQGLAMEDYLLFTEREQRRDVLFEQIARQSFHPYQTLLFRARRRRYFKVERSLKGFFVPEYIRKEAADRDISDTFQNMRTYQKFIYTNFYSDMTPVTHYSATSKLVEYISTYGLLKPEAWDQFFFNEVYNDSYSQEEIQEVEENPFPGIDLNTDAGRREFEKEVNRMIKLYPGSVVKEGQGFNFEEFYAGWAIANGKDTSKYNQTLVADLRKKIEAEKTQSKSLEDKAEKKGKSIIGTVFPLSLIHI
eukprot:TRINITY_DN551_c0_g1_i5.p1 TRINITY_DN551_c0_g1~~TRINITY_DN551_c0_g1_i5.p1  ORF type:complete len:324 (+),score=83.20 TRINITY_DN551_c0_g1_i5:157-1128(+)